MPVEENPAARFPPSPFAHQITAVPRKEEPLPMLDHLL
jgi:hypothetical protein